MNKKFFKSVLLALVIFTLQTALVSATFEVHRVDVEVDENGNALVRNMFFIDSTNISSFFLPVFSPKNIRVYDEKGELSHSVSDGIYIDLRNEEGYSFTVEYYSDIFTSKNASEWTFLNDFYRVGNFDNIRYTLTLPFNAVLNSFSLDGIVYSEDNFINIEWDIPPDILSKRIEVKYSFKLVPEVTTKPVNWFYVSVIILVVFVFLAFVLFKKSKFKSKVKKDFSPEQKDFLSTLAENEKKVIQELFKSKKELTQKKVCLLTGIPKSTLSRTLQKLKMKNFIEIRDYGNTKVIKLTKWFLEKQ